MATASEPSFEDELASLDASLNNVLATIQGHNDLLEKINTDISDIIAKREKTVAEIDVLKQQAVGQENKLSIAMKENDIAVEKAVIVEQNAIAARIKKKMVLLGQLDAALKITGEQLKKLNEVISKSSIDNSSSDDGGSVRDKIAIFETRKPPAPATAAPATAAPATAASAAAATAASAAAAARGAAARPQRSRVYGNDSVLKGGFSYSKSATKKSATKKSATKKRMMTRRASKRRRLKSRKLMTRR